METKKLNRSFAEYSYACRFCKDKQFAKMSDCYDHEKGCPKNRQKKMTDLDASINKIKREVAALPTQMTTRNPSSKLEQTQSKTSSPQKRVTANNNRDLLQQGIID